MQWNASSRIICKRDLTYSPQAKAVKHHHDLFKLINRQTQHDTEHNIGNPITSSFFVLGSLYLSSRRREPAIPANSDKRASVVSLIWLLLLSTEPAEPHLSTSCDWSSQGKLLDPHNNQTQVGHKPQSTQDTSRTRREDNKPHSQFAASSTACRPSTTWPWAIVTGTQLYLVLRRTSTR